MSYWSGKEQLMNWHNNVLNIKLTYKIGRSNMDFLDIMFDVDEHGFVRPDLYRKINATNLLLHVQSAHPRHLCVYAESVQLKSFLKTGATELGR